MTYPKGKPKTSESREATAERMRRYWAAAKADGRRKTKYVEIACAQCLRLFQAERFFVEKRGQETCSPTCRGLLRAQRAVGRTTRTGQGYLRVLVPKGTVGADKSGRMLVHRYVMQQSLGRPLSRHETVHHINRDRLDNRLENLQLRSGRHGVGAAWQCADCGSRNIVATTLLDLN